jgi:hypothetical protein
MKVKNDFLKFGTFTIKDESQIRFWEDKWLGNRPLRDQYPQLYNIARKKQDTVAEVLSTEIPSISWRRDLIVPKLVMWNNLVARLANINLTDEGDEFKWSLDPTGVFSVKTHYLALIYQNVPNRNKKVWTSKLPLKVNFFMVFKERSYSH